LAILLLAVAVEVKVKTSFLGSDSSASNAFDVAQEKGKVAVSPVELISETAKPTFNESFKKTNKADYINIENLFRSRNKVAHRGKGIYSDEHGVLQTVDLATLNLWWISVATLFEWLAHKTGNGDWRMLRGANTSPMAALHSPRRTKVLSSTMCASLKPVLAAQYG